MALEAEVAMGKEFEVVTVEALETLVGKIEVVEEVFEAVFGEEIDVVVVEALEIVAGKIEVVEEQVVAWETLA